MEIVNRSMLIVVTRTHPWFVDPGGTDVVPWMTTPPTE